MISTPVYATGGLWSVASPAIASSEATDEAEMLRMLSLECFSSSAALKVYPCVDKFSATYIIGRARMQSPRPSRQALAPETLIDACGLSVMTPNDISGFGPGAQSSQPALSHFPANYAGRSQVQVPSPSVAPLEAGIPSHTIPPLRNLGKDDDSAAVVIPSSKT
ncbi:hypothetical protein AAF712_012258 [Marasmius tenuissimus]|uniref:Uncharacterized protein n=1 Tax=Marasmius tenuissimus TaxID=585030 RepID=A0ABR2ZHU0_9AGAR